MMGVGGESVELTTDLKCGRIFQKVPGLHLEGTWQLVSEWRHTTIKKVTTQVSHHQRQLHRRLVP